MSNYKYLSFIESSCHTLVKTKPKKWRVVSYQDATHNLGTVFWFAPWRKYCATFKDVVLTQNVYANSLTSAKSKPSYIWLSAKRNVMHPNFRSDYLQRENLRIRAFDAMAHTCAGVTVAYLLSLPWWFAIFQWLPDVALLVMWPYSMVTGKYLSKHNLLLYWHNGIMHTFWIVSIQSVLVMFVSYFSGLSEFAEKSYVLVSLNWVLHLGIDYFTHGETQ